LYHDARDGALNIDNNLKERKRLSVTAYKAVHLWYCLLPSTHHLSHGRVAKWVIQARIGP
jgi:hypothetical protein